LSIPNFSLTASRTIAGTAEKAGFDSVWVNDDLVGVFQKETFDPYLCMAVMAESTRRVSVGSAVLATYRKHPVETALKLISLDNLSRGRLIAGLGSCCPSEQWGFPAREDVNDRFAEFIVLLKNSRPATMSTSRASSLRSRGRGLLLGHIGAGLYPSGRPPTPIKP
jgi:alkanesulfonate monooxygenase SsuD/methylene tetrahydromethanopterin reductase-like flavin-dependent oxidoreductase (luciferase family)